MFITNINEMNEIQASKNPYWTESTSDPIWMLTAVSEADEEYHNLCMKMVKCEHAAIINESQELLDEAENSFKEKAAKLGKTVLAKFMAFIDRVASEWSNLYAKVISKFVSKSKMEEALKNVKLNSGKISAKANPKYILEATKIFEKISSMNDVRSMANGGFDSIKSELKELNSKFGLGHRESGTSTTVAANSPDSPIREADVRMVFEFLGKRRDYITKLKGMKSTAIKAYKSEEKADDGKADSMLISQYSSIVSRTVSFINYATTDAVRICRACLKQGIDSANGYDYEPKKGSGQPHDANTVFAGDREKITSKVGSDISGTSLSDQQKAQLEKTISNMQPKHQAQLAGLNKDTREAIFSRPPEEVKKIATSTTKGRIEKLADLPKPMQDTIVKLPPVQMDAVLGLPNEEIAKLKSTGDLKKAVDGKPTADKKSIDNRMIDNRPGIKSKNTSAAKVKQQKKSGYEYDAEKRTKKDAYDTDEVTDARHEKNVADTRQRTADKKLAKKIAFAKQHPTSKAAQELRDQGIAFESVSILDLF